MKRIKTYKLFLEQKETTSYMFFSNLETIIEQVTELLTMDERDVDNLLQDGHNWAEDHISTAKESIEHVKNFFGKYIKESNGISNYMFFGNLKSIKEMSVGLLKIDRSKIDQMLQEHDWAEDHISATKEKVSHVYDFIKNSL